MSTVGFATLPVIPSLRGMERQIQQQLGGLTAVASRIGGESGGGFIASFGTNLVSGLDGIGETVNRWAGRAFAATGAAAGAVMAAGLWGGMQRALDREDAIVTFRRMGLDDAGVLQLTDDIDQALRGTPIANPEGFALAGRFLAQGFDEAEIPSIVATIADMSTVGNRHFAEMADVMVRAAGQGRITARELNRMGDVPLGRVAEQLGMTEAEMRDLAAAGGLSAEAFLGAFAAIDDFAGAARDPTTRVALTNLRTAWSALGETFLSPIMGEDGAAQQGLLSLRERVDALGPSVERAGEAFFEWLIPALERAGDVITEQIVPAFRDARDWFDENRETIKAVGEAAAPVVGILVAVGSAVNILSRFTPPRLILTAIAAIATGLVYAWENSERFREVVTGAFEWIRDRVGPIIERVRDWILGLAELFSGDGEPSRLLGVFRDRFESIWESISGIVTTVLDLVIESVEGFVDFVVFVFDEWGEEIVRVVEYWLELVVTVFDTVFGVLEGLVTVFAGVIRGDWEEVAEGLQQIASSLWEGVEGIFDAGLQAALDIFGEKAAEIQMGFAIWVADILIAVNNLPRDLARWAAESIGSAQLAFVEAVHGVLVWFAALPGRIIAQVSSLPGEARSWGRDSINEARIGFTERFLALLEWFRNLPGRIVATLSALPSMMRTMGRAAIDGFIEGMRSRMDAAAASALSLAVRVAAQFRRSLMIGSPSRLFEGYGQDTVAGFVKGLDQPRWVSAAVTDMARAAEMSARQALVPLASRGAIGSTPQTGVAGGSSRELHLHVTPDVLEDDRTVFRARGLLRANA